MTKHPVLLGIACVAAGIGSWLTSPAPAAHAAPAQHHYVLAAERAWWSVPGRWRPVHPTPTPTPTPTASTPAPTPSQTGSNPGAPLPAALSGSRLVTSFAPATIAAAPWNSPSNNPGQCPAHSSAVRLNASGYAELDTTGATGDCVAAQSPGLLPTKPGSVYEAEVYFSSFNDWPAFWMYGSNWPNGGEIDSVEGGPGASFVTWHQAGNQTTGIGAWNNHVVSAQPGVPDVSAGAWHTVDIAFTATGVDTYYDGKLYVHIPETVTTGGSDPMYLVFSDGSCDQPNGDVCVNAPGNDSPAGNVQVRALREYA